MSTVRLLIVQRCDFDQDTQHLVASVGSSPKIVGGTAGEARGEVAPSATRKASVPKRLPSSCWLTLARRAAYGVTVLLVLTCIAGIFSLNISLLFRALAWGWVICAGACIVVGLYIGPRERKRGS